MRSKKQLRYILPALALCLVLCLALPPVTASAAGPCYNCGGQYNDDGLCIGSCEGVLRYQSAEESNGQYEIDNVGNLFWFAALVNGTLHDPNGAPIKDANGILLESATGSGIPLHLPGADAVLTDNITVNRGITFAADGSYSNPGYTEVLEWTPIGTETSPYEGTFTGQSPDGVSAVVVSGLYHNHPASSGLGLFGVLDTGAEVKDVGVSNSYFRGSTYVGGIAGKNNNGSTITGCVNYASVYGSSYIGGVTGSNAGTVTACTNSGTVNGISSVGGVAGYNAGMVEKSGNTADASVTARGTNIVGGVVGVNSGGTISNSYNHSTQLTSNIIGGIVGEMNTGTASCCYTTYGTIMGTQGAGARYDNCYYRSDDGTESSIFGVTPMTTEQFASCEVAFHLQAAQPTADLVWGQINGSEPYPVLGGRQLYERYQKCKAVYVNDSVSSTGAYDETPDPHTYGDPTFNWDQHYETGCSVAYECSYCLLSKDERAQLSEPPESTDNTRILTATITRDDGVVCADTVRVHRVITIGCFADRRYAQADVDVVTLTKTGTQQTGYKAAWKSEQSINVLETTEVDGTFTMIDEPVTVEGSWVLIEYPVIYHLGGGDSDEPEPIQNHIDNPLFFTYESGAINLNDPWRNGYTFVGWYTAATSGRQISQIPARSSAPVEVFARWNIVEYTITYNLNGGTNHRNNPVEYTIADDDITLNNPSRDGYSFEGWYDLPDGGDRIYTILNGSTGDVTLYARWKEATYSIEYFLDGGANHPDNPDSYKSDDPDIYLNEPSREGYAFNGWYDSEAGGKKVTRIEQGSIEDIKLYARWTAIPYKITYVLGGGENHEDNPATYTIESGDITFNAPSRTGYIFNGWYDQADDGDEKTVNGNRITEIPQGSTGSVTLYAHWVTNAYTITYNLGGGRNHANNPLTYTRESATIILNNPSRTGYTFNGWYDSQSGGKRVTEIPQNSTGPVVLYARWTVITYNIRYELDGGTNHKNNPASYTIESGTIKLNDPTREGLIFDGWYDSTGRTRITEIPEGSIGDVTLYAHWTVEGLIPSYTPYTEKSNGWDEITKELDQLRVGTTGASLTVEMNGTVAVPAKALKEIVNRNITVRFNMGGGIYWEINGKDVTSKIEDLNLAVATGGGSIPMNVVNTITGEISTLQLELGHEGDFGTTLRLYVDVGTDNRGYFANLYYYTGQILRFRQAARVDERGWVSWTFTSASSYLIVIDDINHTTSGWLNPFTDVTEIDWFYADVEFAYRNNLIYGVTDTLFAPQGEMTRGQIVTILWRMENKPVLTTESGFTDVVKGSYYADAVNWAAARDIVSGYSSTLFGPDDPITREQLIAILYRYADYKNYNVSIGGDISILTYADAAQISGYALTAMQWAVSSEVIFGNGDRMLEPTAEANRAQATAIIHRFIKKYGPAGLN